MHSYRHLEQVLTNRVAVDVGTSLHFSGFPTNQALAAPREDQSHFLGVIHYKIAVGFRAGILKTGTTDEAISTPL